MLCTGFPLFCTEKNPCAVGTLNYIQVLIKGFKKLYPVSDTVPFNNMNLLFFLIIGLLSPLLNAFFEIYVEVGDYESD